jgi:hypothetical protein
VITRYSYAIERPLLKLCDLPKVDIFPNSERLFDIRIMFFDKKRLQEFVV